MSYLPFTERTERIATQIVDAGFKAHQTLGPGLLESIHEICFCHELAKRGLGFQRQVSVPITYDGIRFDEGVRLDVLVENEIICELKAVEKMNPVYQAQLLTQMKLVQKRLGFLINFNVVYFKQGVKRVVL